MEMVQKNFYRYNGCEQDGNYKKRLLVSARLNKLVIHQALTMYRSYCERTLLELLKRF